MSEGSNLHENQQLKMLLKTLFQGRENFSNGWEHTICLKNTKEHTICLKKFKNIPYFRQGGKSPLASLYTDDIAWLF